MLFQLIALLKCLLTVWAAEWFTHIVGTDVFVEGAPLRKRFITQWTWMWFLTYKEIEEGSYSGDTVYISLK